MRYPVILLFILNLVFFVSCKTVIKQKTEVPEKTLTKQKTEVPTKTFFQNKMNEMLSFLSENCGNIPGIHAAHNPCKYNYKIKLPKILKVSS